MNPSRQLAVVMFTDIVGYTGMMQNDETLALVKLNHFKAALNNHVPRFNGEIIQYYGDGALMIFSNSTDAVSCGSELQENFFCPGLVFSPATCTDLRKLNLLNPITNL